MADPGSWDLLDEDCSDISDWTDGDSGDCISQVNPAGQFEFDANTSAGGGQAYRYRDIGDYPNTFTFEIKVYHDDIGTLANSDYFRVQLRQADEEFLVLFATDGIYINDTDAGYTEVGTNLVKEGGSAEWQTWRFLVTFGAVGDGVCDVYLKDSTHNNEKVGTAIPCSREAALISGQTQIRQFGTNTDDMMTHIDYLKIATGLYIPEAEVAVDSAIFFGSNF